MQPITKILLICVLASAINFATCLPTIQDQELSVDGSTMLSGQLTSPLIELKVESTMRPVESIPGEKTTDTEEEESTPDEKMPDTEEDENDESSGPSLAQQVLDEEDVALQAEVEEDLAASAEVHLMKGARGRSAKYGRMKSKYKSFKVFKSGKGSYKRGYYGSYHGYRRGYYGHRYYIYGIHGHPYGHGHGHVHNGRPAADCANSNGITGYSFSHNGLWGGGGRSINGEVAGINTGKSPSAKACAAVCSADPKCVAFHYYAAGSTACYKYYAGHGAAVKNNNFDTAYTRCSAAPNDTTDGLPRPVKGKSKVVMFVIKDEDGKAEKLNAMYERIGNFLWTQTEFAAIKNEMVECTKKTNGTVPVSFADCTMECRQKHLNLFVEQASTATTPTDVAEDMQTEVQSETNSLPKLANGQKYGWIVVESPTSAENVAAKLTDEINSGKATTAFQLATTSAVMIDDSAAAPLRATVLSLLVAVAVVFALF